MSLLSAALDVIFPPACPGCGADHPPAFCASCLPRLPPPRPPLCRRCGLSLSPAAADTCATCLERPPAFDRARACAVFSAVAAQPSPLRVVLHRFKYERELAEAGALVAVLRRRCPLDLGAYDVAVPVPLHLARLRWRGFNQAQVLLAPVAREHGLAVEPRALERARPTDPQVRLDAAARRRNVRGAFRVRRPEAVRGRRVLLFDDVYTSGATADACARALRRAGATAVDVLALAHAVVA